MFKGRSSIRGEPAADLLKQPLFLRRPGAGRSALVQAEQIRFIPLGIDREGDGGLDAEALSVFLNDENEGWSAGIYSLIVRKMFFNRKNISPSSA